MVSCAITAVTVPTRLLRSNVSLLIWAPPHQHQGARLHLDAPRRATRGGAVYQPGSGCPPTISIRGALTTTIPTAPPVPARKALLNHPTAVPLRLTLWPWAVSVSVSRAITVTVPPWPAQRCCC